jgi:hypothetical protein
MNGFQRWLQKNPGGSMEQYQQALQAYNKTKTPSPSPEGRWLPGGVFVPLGGISPAEMASVVKEFAQQAYGQQ